MSEDRHVSRRGKIRKDAAQSKLSGDKQSPDELLEELTEKWCAMTESDYDPEMVNAYLSVLDEIDPMDLAFDAEESCAAFRKKHAFLFASANTSSQLEEREKEPAAISNAKPRKVRTRFLAGRVAAIAVVAIMGSVFIAQAFGWDVFGLLATWTADTFQLQIGQPEENIVIESGPTEFASLQEAQEYYNITEPVVPTWLPEGFELSGKVIVESTPGKIVIKANYLKDAYDLNIRITKYVDAEEIKLGAYEKDDMNEVTTYERNGIIHYIMSNYDMQKIVWVNNACLCSVSGSQKLSMDEATHMIDSIYE